eukprot:7332894-Lingulodinium_polyedra.AAC.1
MYTEIAAIANGFGGCDLVVAILNIGDCKPTRGNRGAMSAAISDALRHACDCNLHLKNTQRLRIAIAAF